MFALLALLTAAANVVDPQGWQKFRFGMSEYDVRAAIGGSEAITCRPIDRASETQQHERECVYFKGAEQSFLAHVPVMEHFGPVKAFVSELRFFLNKLWIIELALYKEGSD